MKYLVLLLWSVHVVDTELFIRSNNHMLDQLIHDKPSRNSRECATLCDKTNGCKAFNFTNSEHRCILARNTRDVDTFDSSVYAHKSVICSRFGQSCYRLFTSWKLGDAATAHCESIGHHMLTITSAEENRFVTDLVKEVYGSADAWILLGCMYTPGNAVEWVTGENWIYSSWSSWSPYPVNSSMCIEMYITASQPDGLWGITSCDHGHFYVCEKDLA